MFGWGEREVVCLFAIPDPEQCKAPWAYLQELTLPPTFPLGGYKGGNIEGESSHAYHFEALMWGLFASAPLNQDAFQMCRVFFAARKHGFLDCLYALFRANIAGKEGAGHSFLSELEPLALKRFFVAVWLFSVAPEAEGQLKGSFLVTSRF